MKRLALVLAATAVLGTGCYVDGHGGTCGSTVTLQWDFQDWDGAVRGCTASQREPVDSVDVWVDGNYVATFNCFEGSGTIALGRGSRLVTVEGISAGRIAYRHEFFEDPACGDQLVLVRPAQGTVTVDYAFIPTNACHTPPTYMALEVQDDIAQQRAFIETAATGPQCSTTAAAPEYTLPVGSFTLRWIEEVTGQGAVLAADCADRPFSVGPGSFAIVNPTLVDTAFACPDAP